MIWLVGFLGLIVGFVAGQFYLIHALKDKTRHELLHDRALRWSYGVVNWVIAIFTSIASVLLYRQFF